MSAVKMVKKTRDLDVVKDAHGVSLELEVDENELDLAAGRHSDRPETVGAVTVRQWIVGRHETARQTTQLTATTCIVYHLPISTE